MLSLAYVEGVSWKGHKILGFLDLKERAEWVTSPLDLTPLWLTPNRDDLTFYNLSTHNSAAGSTRNFQVSVDSKPGVSLVFYLPMLDVFLQPSPTRCEMWGTGAPSLTVELEQFPCPPPPSIYTKIIFYNITAKPVKVEFTLGHALGKQLDLLQQVKKNITITTDRRLSQM